VIVQQRTSPLAIVLLVLVLIMLGLCVVSGMMLSSAAGSASKLVPDEVLDDTFVAGDERAGDEVALVPIHGTIVEGSDAGLPFMGGQDMVEMTRKRLGRAESGRTAAVLVEVNSPGGGVTASARIHRMLTDFKAEQKKPVVVLMMDIAASGGYYVAAPADWIVAAPSTLTGSIGVLLQHWDVSRLLDEKLGVRVDAVVSAPHKDILSPFRPMKDEERRHLQAIVDEMYAQFVKVVVDGRGGKIGEAEVRALQSTVVTGEQAKEKGLVDELGYMEEAVAALKRLTGKSKLKVVRYDRRTSLFDLLNPRVQQAAGGADAAAARALASKLAEPPLQYLWKPGL
jgi:protease-4